MDARCALGRAGETAAAALFRRLGFAILDRNYRCDQGELDLVARRADLVVFCEVKTRRSDRCGIPSEAVDFDKQMRLRRLAARWFRERRPGPVNVRFDVVSVLARGAEMETTHLPDAF